MFKRLSRSDPWFSGAIWHVVNESSQEVLLANIGPAKDKHGVRESFANVTFLFPTSLCGVLVFGSASRPPPPTHPAVASSRHTQLVLTHNLSSHHFSSHHLSSHHLSSHYLSTDNCSHTTWYHTTCSHTTCSHTTCPHTASHHTTSHHTTCHHTTLSSHYLSTDNLSSHNLSSDHFSSHHLSSHHLSSPYLSTGHQHTGRVKLHRLVLCAQLHRVLPSCQVGFGNMDRHFAWQAWHLWHCVGSGGALGSQAALGRRGVLRGRRGTLWHPPNFVWQASHLMTWIVTLRGRHCTYGTGLALVARLVPRPRWDAAAFCVAGVALCDIHLHFVWQASPLMTWIVTLRGRRGTCQHMDRHFAWQAWHLWHWVGSGGALGSQAALGRRGVLRGKRGTLWHPPSLCVAGVALDDMDRHFAW